MMPIHRIMMMVMTSTVSCRESPDGTETSRQFSSPFFHFLCSLALALFLSLPILSIFIVGTSMHTMIVAAAADNALPANPTNHQVPF
jgi:hypothetical protein